MLIRIKSCKTVSETAVALQVAVAANKFGVLHLHDLQETLSKKGVEFDHECLIFEVCNPHSAKQVLDANMSVSTALPCRISVYEENGSTYLSTLKPSVMLALFNVPELKEMAFEVEDTLVKIMIEAAE